MSETLQQRRLRLVPEVETVALMDGTRLLKQTRRAEYLALNVGQQRILDQFTGTATVEEILHRLLVEGPRPGIREFYDLVVYALDHGFLADAGAASAGTGPEVRGRTWRVRWGYDATLATAVAAIPIGLWTMVRGRPALPDTLGGWLVVLVLVAAIVSLAQLATGCVLSGFGRQVYRARVSLKFVLPIVTVDTRDAFMGGRRCQVAVATQALAVPFLAAALASFSNLPLVFFAACLSALLLTSPFGNTPAHNLLHALFRKAYHLPHCAATFLGRKMFRELFAATDGVREEDYLLLYSTYAIVWLGCLTLFGAGIIQREGGELIDNLVYAPDAGAWITAFVPLLLLAALLLGPILYELWLVARNAYAVVAPRWFRAEAALHRATPGASAPAATEIAAFLGRTLLFEFLPDEGRQALAKAMKFVRLSKGTAIIREREAGDSLFIIYSGKVVVSKEDEAGRETVVATLGLGEAFGEIALLDRVPRTATVRTLTAVELLALERTTFERLLLPTLGADRIRSVIQTCAFLRRTDLFSTLPDKALLEAARAFTVADFQPGDILVRENHTNDAFFVVYEGEVEIRRAGRPVERLHTGSFFGEISLLQGIPAVADVVAVTRGRCLRAGREQFLRLISQDVHAGVLVESALAARLPGKGA